MAEPLNPDERESINEFFWSHFKDKGRTKMADMKAFDLDQLEELWHEYAIVPNVIDRIQVRRIIFTAVDAIARQREAEWKHEHNEPWSGLHLRHCVDKRHGWSHSDWIKDTAEWMEEK